MIESIKKRVEIGDYRLTFHAFERCVERNISPEQIWVNGTVLFYSLGRVLW